MKLPATCPHAALRGSLLWGLEILGITHGPRGVPVTVGCPSTGLLWGPGVWGTGLPWCTVGPEALDAGRERRAVDGEAECWRPGAPGMNSLPLVCERGGQGERAPPLNVCAPAREWGPCSEGTHPSVAVRPDSPDCHPVLSGSLEVSTVLGTPLGSG